MTVFNVHDADGRIVQSNKLYDPTGYANILRERGYKFVEHNGSQPINMNDFHVKNAVLTKRSAMPISVSKTEIKAGGQDAAVFTGVPAGALVAVSTAGLSIGGDTVQGGCFDLPIPVPCVYSVLITKWPFQDFRCDVKATP